MLRQQIVVLRRGRPTRPHMMASDRLVLGWLCWLFPKARDSLVLVRPETVLRWHRVGFRLHWGWKPRRRPGGPALSAEIRELIRTMSLANPLWGSTADPWRTAQAWNRRLANKRGQIHGTEEGTSIARLEDLCSQSCGWDCGDGPVRGADRVVSAALWTPGNATQPAADPVLGVTAHPMAEWLANQLMEAFGWEPIPDYLIRDRDACYGEVFVRRM